MKSISRFIIGLLCLCVIACSKSGASGGSSKVSLRIANGGTTRQSFEDLSFVSRLMPGPGAGDFAMNTTAGLQSLKYLISSIAICTSATTQGGFGFSDSAGCVSLYQADTPAYSLTGYPADVTLAATTAAAANQIDFATSTGRARLSGSTTVAAGSYNYALVTWYPGIQVKASIDVGGTTVVTKSGGTAGMVGGSIATTGLGDMTSGTSEDAFVISPNGGAAFRFASPFVVSTAAEYTLDMTFNPAQVLSACKNCPTSGNLRDGANHGMYVPMLSLLPVPRQATESTRRETYLVNVDANKKVRIELYFPSGDSTKIYGVSAYLVFDNSAAAPPFGATDTCRVTDVTVNADGSLKLVNNQYGTVADGLVRGAAGTVSSAMTGGVCGGTASGLTYSFVGTETVL